MTSKLNENELRNLAEELVRTTLSDFAQAYQLPDTLIRRWNEGRSGLAQFGPMHLKKMIQFLNKKNGVEDDFWKREGDKEKLLDKVIELGFN